LKNLLRWLVHMQGVEAELGGVKGRTNKLVDGCYSWWCGGSFSLLEVLGVSGSPRQSHTTNENTTDGVWDDVDDGLFDRHALQGYIFYAGQHPAGGLRDKPPKHSDAYHTHYNLSGLSMAQHHVVSSNVRSKQVEDAWIAPESPLDELRKRSFVHLFSWTEEEGGSYFRGGQANRLNATHPLTNLTITHTEAFATHFYKQTVPQRPRKSRGTTKSASTS